MRLNLRTWIQKALLYYSARQFESFVMLLEASIVKSGKLYVGYKEDLIRTYTLLAGYFTGMAYRETGNRRAALQAKITNLLNAAEELQPNDRLHSVARAYAMMLSSGRSQDADDVFLSILKTMRHSVPCLIGRGCLAYNRRDYIGALGYFKSVLMHYPRGPGDVRVGVGHCFLKMGSVDNARRAFELALEYNGRCKNALVGMAVIKLNVLDKQAQQEAIYLLCAAYEQYNRDPMILSCLAQHFYYVKSYERVQTLAGNAIAHTDSAELRAQNFLQIARSFHAVGNFDRAFEFYKMSVKSCPNSYAPPHLGLAQMYLRRNQLDKAINCLQTLLKIVPDNLLGLRLLSLLYVQDNTSAKVDGALEFLNKSLRLSPRLKKDYDIWLIFARAYENKELWSQTINSYEEAVRIFQEIGQCVPVELLNNLGASFMYGKQPQEALVTLDHALARDTCESKRLTIRFNRARVLEELHRDDLAENLYKQLIEECPTYIDCYIRLGQMAAKRQQYVTAMDYYKDVLKVDNDNLTARCLMGNHFMKHGMTTQAMYCHNVILRRRETRRDPYIMVAVGNVCLINVQRTVGGLEDSTFKRHQEKAIQLFRRALEQNPRNLWAANGIGAALCSGGLLNEGEAVFKQILESSKYCTQSLLNLANVSLKLKKYKQASQMYKQCLDEFLPPKSLEIMQLLARSLYEGGKAKEAKLVLLQARHVAPHDQLLLYNLALTIKQYSLTVFGMQRPDLKELMLAEQELKVALRYFDGLVPSKYERQARHQAKKCRDILLDLPEELNRVRELEQLDEDRVRLQEQRYQELQNHLEQQKIQRQEAEKQLQEDQTAKRLEVLERTKKLISNVNNEMKKVPKKNQTKKKRHISNNDDDDVDENARENLENEENTSPPLAKKAKKKNTKEKHSKKSSFKSKAFIESADEEGEDAPELENQVEKKSQGNK
ncbi:RNA polymerase-associated protein CTR9 homolog [Drosophila tropicalis]|uniref:RNA polymerase-associated protein CTR9 homolog n=1 Tax=Drosophila tropicalis TaxID=46794 RepID=UPI0035AC012A